MLLEVEAEKLWRGEEIEDTRFGGATDVREDKFKVGRPWCIGVYVGNVL